MVTLNSVNEGTIEIPYFDRKYHCDSLCIAEMELTDEVRLVLHALRKR